MTTLKPTALRALVRSHTDGDLKADGLGSHGRVDHGGLEEHSEEQEIFTGARAFWERRVRMESAPTLPVCSLD